MPKNKKRTTKAKGRTAYTSYIATEANTNKIVGYDGLQMLHDFGSKSSSVLFCGLDKDGSC